MFSGLSPTTFPWDGVSPRLPRNPVPPTELTDLAPGLYEIKLVLKGYPEQRTAVRVETRGLAAQPKGFKCPPAKPWKFPPHPGLFPSADGTG